MTYKQILRQSYEMITYNQFCYTCALYKRQPFKVLMYDSEKESTTLIIFSHTQSETVTTRQMKFAKDSAHMIVDWLKSDFPYIEVEIIDSE